MTKVLAPMLDKDKISQIELGVAFDVAPKMVFLKQIYLHYLNNNRRIIASTKTRGQVTGSKRKPWKQKGTGRARHGSIYSALWRGGGVTFGPSSEKNYKTKLNQKSKGKALSDSVVLFAQKNRLIIVDEIAKNLSKTKAVSLWVKQLPIEKGSIMVLASKSDQKPAGLNNIKDLYFQSLESPRIDYILNAEWLIITKDAINAIFPDTIKKPKTEAKK